MAVWVDFGEQKSTFVANRKNQTSLAGLQSNEAISSRLKALSTLVQPYVRPVLTKI